MKSLIRLNVFCLLMMMFGSCTTIGPEYKGEESRKEAVQTKEAWSDSSAVKVSPEEVIQKDWWTNFKDPYLNELIEKAISGSFDLKILAGRIQEAGATIKQEKAGLLPSADLTITKNYSSEKLPDENGGNAQGSGTSAGQPTGGQSASGQNIIGTQLSWEIDMWGKNKNKYLASEAEYKATGADYRAGYLTLVADVANAYIQIRQTDKQAGMTRTFYKNNRQILKIYENQYSEGLVSKEKVLRQKAEVQSLEQDLLELERQRKTLENRIATLLGKPSGELKIPNTESQNPLQPVKVPVGLPSELLSRRPDIIAAEYRVLKAYKQIGVAKAERLPSIKLTAEGGLKSIDLSSLTLGFAPTINLPIFDGGKGKATVATNEARAQIAADEYRKKVIEAFKEVEDALVSLDSRTKQKAVLEDKVNGLRQVQTQIHGKLKMGLISQLEVLDIERELLNAEKSLLEMHRSLLEDNVTLYKALGGGWPKEVVQ
jgi:outer membrane protein, multidrug efflux system